MSSKNNKIICVRLLGGFGNQLFIYAFGKALALEHGYRVIFDIKTGYKKDKYGRTPKLSKYINDISFASSSDIIIFYFTKIFPSFAKKIFNAKVVLEENSRSFLNLDEKLINSKLFFIEGHFQSYLYFNKYEDVIRNNIILKVPASKLITKIAGNIKSSNSISLHVRRVQYSHLLSLNYYLEAMAYVDINIGDPEYFVFSDDIEWCRANIITHSKVTYVVHDDKDEVADLWLMSICKNHIIANSSFSWWGAWLCENRDKIVIAPQNIQIGVLDKFYPKEWIII